MFLYFVYIERLNTELVVVAALLILMGSSWLLLELVDSVQGPIKKPKRAAAATDPPSRYDCMDERFVRRAGRQTAR